MTSAFPDWIEPMAATLTQARFTGPEWIVERKFDAIRLTLAGDAPFISRAIFSIADEGELADMLLDLVKRHPRVTIGSYPQWKDPSYRVKLTIDGNDETAVDAAATDLATALGESRVVIENG